MTTCPNGHSVQDGAAFCSTCGAPVTVASSPEPDLAVPVDDPGSWLTNRRVFTGLAVLLVFGIVGAILAATLGGNGTKPTDSGANASKPLSASDVCVNEVENFLNQVPSALRAGYQDGVDTQSLAVQYGYASPIVQIASTVQSELIGNVAQSGDPEGQVSALLPDVAKRCVAAFPGSGPMTPSPTGPVQAVTPTFDPSPVQSPGSDGCPPVNDGTC